MELGVMAIMEIAGKREAGKCRLMMLVEDGQRKLLIRRHFSET